MIKKYGDEEVFVLLDNTFFRIKSLDKIDNKILKLLSENSRMTYVEIGEKVSLSRVAVRNRIKSLEEQGIIERYSIIINPQKIGRTVSAFFNIETEPEYLYEVADVLGEKECITDIYQMTGSSNLHVHAVFTSNDDLERFLSENLYRLKGIKGIDCDVILSRIKIRKGIRL